jgi:DivIVA domain-containing protein
VSITPDEIRTKPFLTERKGGYNRDEVVAFLDQVAAEFENLQSQFENLETQPERDAADAEELDRLRAEAGDTESIKAELESTRSRLSRIESEKASLEQKLAKTGDPTSQIGDEVASVLKTAHEAASDLKRRAEQELEQAEASATGQRDQARREAGDILAVARRQAEEIVDEARQEADDLVTKGMIRHEELVAAQDEVKRRLGDTESVIRGLWSKLDAAEPKPAPVTHEPARPGDWFGENEVSSNGDHEVESYAS